MEKRMKIEVKMICKQNEIIVARDKEMTELKNQVIRLEMSLARIQIKKDKMLHNLED